MKNIHVLPTDKPSRLFLNKKNNTLFINEQFDESSPKIIALNIYITSNEEIKPNVYALINKVLCKTELLEGKIVSRQLVGGATMDICKSEYLEIILTTDQDLIKDGVQAIYGEFLNWFVKNPSCEEVKIEKVGGKYFSDRTIGVISYDIIIPKEEPKQEALEEAVKNSSFSLPNLKKVMFKFDEDEPEHLTSFHEGGEFIIKLKEGKIKFENGGKKFELYIETI